MNYSVNVIPNELNGLEHTELKTQVIPRVIDKLENGALNIIDEAIHTMNNHAILYIHLMYSIYTLVMIGLLVMMFTLNQ